jgi:hypothetical protein
MDPRNGLPFGKRNLCSRAAELAYPEADSASEVLKALPDLTDYKCERPVSMSFRARIVPCLLLTLLTPFADATTRHSNIPKNAKYKNITGAKHFKYKSPKTQKLKKH